MRKKISFALALLTLIALLMPLPLSAARDAEFRAVWVATVINLDYPSSPGVSVDIMKSEARHILDRALEFGFNTVILQVRPTGDAFYKSGLFPWSAYLTGEQGKAPAGGFDPLEYWISEAHARGLELHAWINPFRVTRVSADNPAMSPENPAVKNPGWTIKTADGALIYDPGLPEVRKLVIDGVKEIVENYDVDGVHFDDYFYPSGSFDDDSTYAKYSGNYIDRGNWRRENINRLIEDTYKAVKSANPGCVFGVAPVAIWANKSSTSLGSDTNGQESYYAQYADTRKWVKNDWLDYIAPQIYWSIGQNNSDYAKVLAWWVDTVKDTEVDLYVGHATWRLNSSDRQSAWYGTNEIVRQINLNRTYPEVKGSVHFRFAFIDNDPAI
ncbi:MAG: family 10 glycosylhydrolase, partial [Clostridiales bacterium]|nr:family 10 glycosylhydrolase [Clostridiales bacterium]